jgi:hypothetical protein
VRERSATIPAMGTSRRLAITVVTFTFALFGARTTP